MRILSWNVGGVSWRATFFLRDGIASELTEKKIVRKDVATCFIRKADSLKVLCISYEPENSCYVSDLCHRREYAKK